MDFHTAGGGWNRRNARFIDIDIQLRCKCGCEELKGGGASATSSSGEAAHQSLRVAVGGEGVGVVAIATDVAVDEGGELRQLGGCEGVEAEEVHQLRLQVLLADIRPSKEGNREVAASAAGRAAVSAV